jgi:hypothetical protein
VQSRFRRLAPRDLALGGLAAVAVLVLSSSGVAAGEGGGFNHPGNLLITDQFNSPLPANAVQLANGDISIADQFDNRAIIIDPEKHIVFQYGMTNVAGNGPNQLNAPYTSFVVGDYTGQTPPPATF